MVLIVEDRRTERGVQIEVAIAVNPMINMGSISKLVE